MRFERCPICGEYDFTDEHKCSPKWEGSVPDYYGDDEWRSVYAYDEEDAAKELADITDADNDRDLLNGGEMTVLIRKPGGTEAKKFVCTAEHDIIYRATEVAAVVKMKVKE